MLRTASRGSLSKRSSPSHSFSTLRSSAPARYPRRSEWIIRVAHDDSQTYQLSVKAVRLLSTSSARYYPKEDAASTEPDGSSLPPPSPPNRKGKVELRPGPLKPGKTDATTKTKSKAAQSTQSNTILSKMEKDVVPTTVVGPAAEAEQSKPGMFQAIFDQTAADVRDAQLKGVMAPPPADAGKMRALVHQGLEIFVRSTSISLACADCHSPYKFYFRGLKLIYSHNKQVRAIRRRVRDGGEPMSRWESRFIRTHSQDLVKLVPFALTILLLEEVIPLIVIYAPFMLPSTCILPAQRLRIDTKRIEKQGEARETGRADFQWLRTSSDSQQHISTDKLSSGATALVVSRLLGLPTFPPLPGLRKHRVIQRLKYLAEDDALLIQEGNGSRLTRPELMEALLERGIILKGLDDTQIDGRLKWWLSNVNGSEGDAIARRLMLVAEAGAMQ